MRPSAGRRVHDAPPSSPGPQLRFRVASRVWISMDQNLARVNRVSLALSSTELAVIARQASARNVTLWDVLTFDRRLSDDAVADSLSVWLKLPRVRIDSAHVEPAATQLVSHHVARRHICLPLRLLRGSLVLAMANPEDGVAISEVQSTSSRALWPVVAARSEILKGIDRHYAPAVSRAIDPAALPEPLVAVVGDDVVDLDQPDSLERSDIAPVVDVCRRVVLAAARYEASDIHIEPGPEDIRIRFRIDGVLRDHLDLPAWMLTALISRIKILAKLDIAQQRMPQDGKMKAKAGGVALDIRVSTLPTQYGEKAVLRLLGSGRPPSFDDLGLSGDEMRLVDEA